MGSGRWSTDVYRTRESSRKKSGKSAFAYYDTVKRSGKLKPHPSLDPLGATSRESRDSAEHPDSNSIAVFLDVTGSMRKIPMALQKDLPQLLGLLLYKDYIPHPQILFGAVGDAYSDRVPLQVGQFESDNRMDENLQNLVLEGGGGGQNKGSYDLAFYFMAHHTAIDCWEKRKKKGYLFVIGDEHAYPQVSKKQVNDLIGAGLEADIPIKDIINEVKEKFNLYYIIPTGTSHGKSQALIDFWKDLVGAQQVLLLENPEDVAELIALTIGMAEGTIDLDGGIEDLKASGVEARTIDTVTKALTAFPAGGAVAKSSGSLSGLTATDDDSGTTRL